MNRGVRLLLIGLWSYSIAFWFSLALAQTPMLPGFPPGTFQNRAALDAGSAPALPVVTYISNIATSGVGTANFTTGAAANIGTAVATRRVILVAAGGQPTRTLTACTINGVNCDASSIVNLTSGTSLDLFSSGSAVVASGTTGVTITLTFSSSVFTAPQIGIYTVNDTLLSSITPVTGYNEVTSGLTNPATVTTLVGGFVITSIYIQGAGSGSGVSGTESYTPDALDVNINPDVSFGHANGVSANASSNITWTWIGTGTDTAGVGAFAWR